MEWTTYALIAAGSLGFISLVMGLVEALVWRRWEKEQRSQHLAWLEDEVRAQRLLARSLQEQIATMRGNYGHQREQAFCQGWDEGEAEGHRDGYDHGFSDGYDTGYAAGRDDEHKYWTEPAHDECDPFGMERPEGVYDEPDNGAPAVIAAINGALAEGPEAM